MVLNPSLEECLKRNSKRTGFELVPDSAIRKMYHELTFPTQEELSQFDFKGKITVIVRSGMK